MAGEADRDARIRIRLDDRVKPNKDVVQHEFEDGLLLLNLRTADCFELDPIGARTWMAIRSEPRLRFVLEALLREYHVQPDVLEADILGLVCQLMGVGVLERLDA